MTISAIQFSEALTHMKRPSASVCAILRAHFKARGRVSTMTLLAEAAGYASFSPVNLHYGALARRIARHLAISEPSLKMPQASDAYLSLLVDFIKPEAVTNVHWLLGMKPEFAEALKNSGWITTRQASDRPSRG